MFLRFHSFNRKKNYKIYYINNKQRFMAIVEIRFILFLFIVFQLKPAFGLAFDTSDLV